MIPPMEYRFDHHRCPLWFGSPTESPVRHGLTPIGPFDCNDQDCERDGPARENRRVSLTRSPGGGTADFYDGPPDQLHGLLKSGSRS